MERKTYFPPESQLRRIVTEQGICATSTIGEEAQVEGDVNVEDYKEINNDITFD